MGSLVTGILCSLFFNFFYVEGVDLPRDLHPNQVVKYKEQERLTFSLKLENIPQRTKNEQWIAAIYNTSSPTLVANILVDINFLYMFSTTVYKNDHNTSFYLELENTKYNTCYKVVILTLKLVTQRTETIHKCLETCTIKISSWTPREIPKAFIRPSGNVTKQPGESMKITCEAVDVPDITTIAFYRNDKEIGKISDTRYTWTVRINSKSIFHCSFTFLAGTPQTVKTEELIVHLDDVNKTEPAIVVTPPASNTTRYRIGDSFDHTCTSTKPERDNINLTWQKVRGVDVLTLNTSLYSCSVNIVLDESYDGWELQCVPSYYDHSSSPHFITGLGFSTKLVSVATPSGTSLYWYILFCLILLMLIIVSSNINKIGGCVCRKRNPEDKMEFEVQNELYSTDDELVYSQMYDHRNVAPPRNNYNYKYNIYEQ